MMHPNEAVTFLFVPGNRPDRFVKALLSGSDCVILDLEDGVAAGSKDCARTAVGEFARTGARVLVRLNAPAPNSTCFSDDLAALEGVPLAGVVVPKTESAEVLNAVGRHFPGIPLLPLLETGCGIANLPAICCVDGVSRLIFGTVDLQLDLGITGSGEELLLFRSMLVLQSRLAGLAKPVEGPTLTIDEEVQIRADAHRAKRLGFGGKLCIHPSQLKAVEDAFRPSNEEVASARRILSASEAAGGEAISLNGQMIDKPIVEMARQTLRCAKENRSGLGKHDKVVHR